MLATELVGVSLDRSCFRGVSTDARHDKGLPTMPIALCFVGLILPHSTFVRITHEYFAILSTKDGNKNVKCRSW